MVVFYAHAMVVRDVMSFKANPSQHPQELHWHAALHATFWVQVPLRLSDTAQTSPTQCEPFWIEALGPLPHKLEIWTSYVHTWQICGADPSEHLLGVALLMVYARPVAHSSILPLKNPIAILSSTKFWKVMVWLPVQTLHPVSPWTIHARRESTKRLNLTNPNIWRSTVHVHWSHSGKIAEFIVRLRVVFISLFLVHLLLLNFWNNLSRRTFPSATASGILDS